MNLNDAKEAAKNRLSDYLISKNIDISRNFSCLNPLHDDKHPSMCFDSSRNKCHCFSCGADYDIFDLFHAETGLEGKELFSEVYRKFGINVEKLGKNSSKVGEKHADNVDFHVEHFVSHPQVSTEYHQEDRTDFFNKCHKDLEKTDYWQKRGISREICDKFNLGFWEEKQRFVIPTGKSSYNARAVQDVDKKFRYLKPKGAYELFNLKAVENAGESVFVVEGEFDALSVLEAGGIAVALGSSGSGSFVEYLSKNRPKFPLILSLDSDEAGRVGEDKLAAELESMGIEFSRESITLGYKDANEALVNNRQEFVEAVKDAKENVAQSIRERKTKEEEEYRKTSALYGIGEFIDDIKNRYGRSCISTGFSVVDNLLDGGFYSGLYVIGAISSLGKTTFALQIADNAAKMGNDVLVFSLEMAKQELVAKSLSRISYQKSLLQDKGLDYATTTRNLMNGNSLRTPKQENYMNEALKSYASYAGNIFYHIGIGDIGVEEIKKTIERHIRITGKKPLVLIDYLQILAPYESRATDKQNTDKAVVELKRASRDYDVPIFAISSFNRENYTSPVNLQSFKESGAIEYTSDVLIALQYKGMDYVKKEDGKFEDEKTRSARIIALREEQERIAEQPGKFQDIQIKILKNRNGKKGSAELKFCPMFNYFEESKQYESDWILEK